MEEFYGIRLSKDFFNDTFCFEVIIDSHVVLRSSTERIHVAFPQFL